MADIRKADDTEVGNHCHIPDTRTLDQNDQSGPLSRCNWVKVRFRCIACGQALEHTTLHLVS